MIKANYRTFALIGILILAFAVRFYRLGSVPAGFHHDGVSQAYNAFSLITSGHDRYGERFPILFRSFDSFQPPIYTYLTMIPVLLFGNTMFSARFVSAVAGVIIVLLTHLIVKELVDKKEKRNMALLSALIVAISPWAIHFSRRVVEANVGLLIFLVGLLLLFMSLRKVKLFPFAVLMFGISTHAYYSERIIVLLYLPLFVFYFRKHYRKHVKYVVLGFILFIITQLPHLWIAQTGALSNRLGQVSYLGNLSGGLPGVILVAQEFLGHLLAYLSLSNLFSDTGNELARVAPDVGVFYSWMLIPLIAGVYYFLTNYKNKKLVALGLLFVVSLVPAALTGDEFYPLRVLEYLWSVSVVIAAGLLLILGLIRKNTYRIGILVGIVLISLLSFYTSYFVLFQNETTEYLGQSYIELNDYLRGYKDKEIVVDSTRDFAVGLRLAYFSEYSPEEMRNTLKPQLISRYYSNDSGRGEIYRIENIVARPIKWDSPGDPCKDNAMIVGDSLAISEEQASEHGLEIDFEITNTFDEPVLKVYLTNPRDGCSET